MIKSLNTELDITAVDKMLSELEERAEFSSTASTANQLCFAEDRFFRCNGYSPIFIDGKCMNLPNGGSYLF